MPRCAGSQLFGAEHGACAGEVQEAEQQAGGRPVQRRDGPRQPLGVVLVLDLRVLHREFIISAETILLYL